MPIRLRIAFLALAAVIGVVSALFIVYRDERREIAALEDRIARIELARSGSQLVHMLQRERGSSGGYLANRAADFLARVTRNRANTDAVLGPWVDTARPPHLIPQSRLLELRSKLAYTRERIDAGHINWQFTRDFYTSAIVELMDAVAIQATFQDGGRQGINAYATIELAAAREALGLIRATIYYISSQRQPSPRDFVDLAIYYGLFQEHTHEFLRGLPPASAEAEQAYFRSHAYLRVIAVVEAMLQSDFISGQLESDKWWEDSTQVVDHFKKREDEAYRKQIEAATNEVTQRTTRLDTYAVVAVLIGLAITLFAALTIVRILKALGELSQTLDGVMGNENFTLRIHDPSRSDEFSQIGRSLNRLLEFTDSLIRDKERLAATDSLTGIMNRRSFMKFAAQELLRANRYGTGFTFLFIDIDHFKRVNDTHGHSTGDEVLVRFADILRRNLRASDLVARWGGEEFVVLAPETTPEQGLLFAEKLRELVAAEEFPLVGPITCSLGIANWQPGESFDALSQRADSALYQAKAAGRNRVATA